MTCKIAESHEYDCGSDKCCYYCDKYSQCKDAGKCDCFDDEESDFDKCTELKK